MALQKQTVNISLRGGVDGKSDERTVIPSKLAVATDVEFADRNTVVQRYPLASRTLPGGLDGETPVRCFEYQGEPHLEMSDGTVARGNAGATNYNFWGNGAQTWDVSTYKRVGALTKRLQGLTPRPYNVGSSPMQDRNFDVAESATTYMIAWEGPSTDPLNSTASIFYSLRDSATDVELQKGSFEGMYDPLLGPIPRYYKPRVVYESSLDTFTLFFAYQVASGGTNLIIRGAQIAADGSAPMAASIALVTVVGGVAPENGSPGTESLFDVVAGTQGFFLVARHHETTITDVYVSMIAPDLSSYVVSPAAVSIFAAGRPRALTAYVTGGVGAMVGHVFYGFGNELHGIKVTNAGVTTVSTLATCVGGSYVGRLTAYPSGSDIAVVFDNVTSTSNHYATTQLVIVTTAHAFVSRTAIGTNCFLVGRAFTLAGSYHAPFVFESQQFQSVMLLVDVQAAESNLGSSSTATPCEPSVTARIDWGELATPLNLALNACQRLPNCSETMLPYLKYETNTRLAGGNNVTGIAIAAASFNATEQLGDMDWNGTKVLAGALPRIVDGQSIVEEGFHWAPEAVGTLVDGLIEITPVAAASGVLFTMPAPGTYRLAFTESWQDAQGNWHESGTATLCTITTTAPLPCVPNVVIRPPSTKKGRMLTMYRSLEQVANTDTTLYLAHRYPLLDGETAITDPDLITSEPLYTEGGLLPNTPAPSCRHIAEFQQRLVLSGCGDGSRIYFSKQRSSGFGPEFVSDEPVFQQTVPSRAGRVVATQDTQGKLLVLCEKELGIIFGNGPDSTGTQNSYQPYERVVDSVGAKWSAPKSVAASSEGVWFQSPFGIRLFAGGIARAGDKQLGSEVDVTIDQDDMVAVFGGSSQQLHFFASAEGGSAVVWDQHWQQFSTFSQHVCFDACAAGGTYFLLGSDGANPMLRYRTTTNALQEAGNTGTLVDIRGYIETAWLTFGGIQGFQRIYRMVMVGEENNYLTDTPSFEIRTAYDYDMAGLAASVTPVTLPVGTEPHIQFEHHLARQKCESLKIGLKFGPGIAANRIRLTDIALSVGVKGGPWRSAREI